MHPPDVGVVSDRKESYVKKTLEYKQSEQLSVWSLQLTAWCWAYLWSLLAWSSQSVWLYTARSSLWSRSSELCDDALSCRCYSPVFLALPRPCRRRRPIRCSSGGAWSCGLSPAGPGIITWTRSFSSHLNLILSFFKPMPASSTQLLSFPNLWHLALFVPVWLSFLWRCCRLQNFCTWGKSTPTDNTRSPNPLKKKTKKKKQALALAKASTSNSRSTNKRSMLALHFPLKPEPKGSEEKFFPVATGNIAK